MKARSSEASASRNLRRKSRRRLVKNAQLPIVRNVIRSRGSRSSRGSRLSETPGNEVKSTRHVPEESPDAFAPTVFGLRYPHTRQRSLDTSEDVQHPYYAPPGDELYRRNQWYSGPPFSSFRFAPSSRYRYPTQYYPGIDGLREESRSSSTSSSDTDNTTNNIAQAGAHSYPWQSSSIYDGPDVYHDFLPRSVSPLGSLTHMPYRRSHAERTLFPATSSFDTFAGNIPTVGDQREYYGNGEYQHLDSDLKEASHTTTARIVDRDDRVHGRVSMQRSCRDRDVVPDMTQR